MEQKQKLPAKNRPPLKKVTHQEIYALYNTVEQLSSWNEPLKLLENFFSDQNRPVNKQRIAKQYYAQSKIFMAFLSDYQILVEKMEQQITLLKQSEQMPK
ncbi:MAG TPA: hypothetical protein VK118_04075 [Tetragenococcus sp.]|nr:hypothetical protein [Tetragenococcus sp.]